MARGPNPMHLWILLVVAAGEMARAAPWREAHLPVVLPENLRDFVRRLTHQQMQTTQNLQSGVLPRFDLPLVRPRVASQPEEADPLLDFPFQSGGGGGARSYASASASATAKRPSVQAQASAYASVRDVKDEEQMDERINSEAKSSAQSFTPSGHPKSSTPQEASDDADDYASTKKGEPYALRRQQVETVFKAEDSFSDIYFVAIVAGCCAVGILGVISAGICFYKLQKSRKAAADVDYPAYGVTGPNKDVSSPNGDRKLAQSAQMYHYQHQKQQMIAVEKAGSTKNTSASDVDSEEENEEGDYTVYECPGLAPTGEMEVKNPLFHDDSTPVSPPVLPSKSDSNQNN